MNFRKVGFVYCGLIIITLVILKIGPAIVVCYATKLYFFHAKPYKRISTVPTQPGFLVPTHFYLPNSKNQAQLVIFLKLE